MSSEAASEPASEPRAGGDRLTATGRKERIVEFFERLDKDHMDLVDDFYAEDCRFEDPLGEIDGRAKLRAYYAGLYGNVQEISFVFDDIVEEGDLCAAPWTMKLRAKLGGGKLIEVPGISRIRFDASGKASFHQDYFDLGAFVYENVPILASMVRFVKRKMSDH